MAEKPTSRQASDLHWHREPGTASVQPGRRLPIVLTVLLLVLVACGILLVRLLRPAPHAFFLSIYVGEYQSRLYPFVAFAGEDSSRLKHHFPRHEVPETKTRELLKRELDDLAQASKWADRPLVFYLNTLALVRHGDIYLLPANADPHGNGDDQVPLEELLSAMKQCPAPQKLLILDLAHPLADARLGVLSDRVAERLQTRLNGNEPNFFVWCSCAGGQLSLTAETLQGSVFAYFLDRGLSGEADGAGPDGADDGRITARELFAYVQDGVKAWTWQNRRQQQTPLAFGKTKDFVLATSPWREAAAGIARPYPKDLRDSWDKLDAWRRDPDLRPPPEFFLRVQNELLRQDERWRSRTDAREIPAEIGKVVRRADEERQNFKSPQIPLRSIQAKPGGGSTALEDALREILTTKKLPAKGDKNAPPDKLKDEKQEAKARALVKVLAGLSDLHPHQVDVALDLLGPNVQDEQHIERIYLNRLKLFFKNRPDAPHRPYLAAIFFKTLCARQAALAELAREPFPLPWTAPLLDAADKDRRLGEKQLLHGPAKAWPRPDSPDDNPLERAQKGYESARTLIVSLHGCRAALEKAQAFLPGYVAPQAEQPKGDPVTQVWSEAAALAAQLQAFLQAPPKSGAADTRQQDVSMQEIRYKLAKDLTELAAKLERRLQDAGPEQALVLLRSPLLTGRQREGLWKLETAAKPEENDSRASAARDTGDSFRQALTRAYLGLNLFRLSEHPGVEKVERVLRTATGPDDIDRLERAFREANMSTGAKPASAARRPERWREFARWLAGRHDQEAGFWECEEPGERELVRFLKAAADELGRWGQQGP